MMASQGICGADLMSKIVCITWRVAVVWVIPQTAHAADPWGDRRQNSAETVGAG